MTETRLPPRPVQTTRHGAQDWLPEQPLLLYPSLAVELGVEEALLVTLLSQATAQAEQQVHQGQHWYTLSAPQMAHIAPFWQMRDVQRLLTNLRSLNVITLISAPYVQSQLIKFTFNRRNPHATTPPTATPLATAIPAREPTPGNAFNFIAPHWMPERSTLTQLAQLGVPENFALAQVGEFVTYWRERNEPSRSWESKFFQQALSRWREHQANENAKPTTTLMSKDWRPSEDALDVLTRHAGISRSFVEDAIPEFVLFWREQATPCDNWNRRFRDHVNRQWAKFTATLEHDPTPKRISDGWQPSKDVYDVLRLANIDLQFAAQLIPEFVIYWRDSNQVHSSWNTRFLQYVKRRWATRANEAFASQGSSTRDISLEALVTDRSWAD